ncbi:MAG: integration host factor subunit beta [Myxococcota bacterium]
MTKSDLVEKIAEKNRNISKKDIEIIVNTIFESMRNSLIRGERIEIRGFGSFTVKSRNAREGRNPKTGEVVHITQKRVPYFKVGKELRERVNMDDDFEDDDDDDDDDE